MRRVSSPAGARPSAVAAALVAALVMLGPGPVAAEHAACAPATVSGGEWAQIGSDLAGTRSQPNEHHLDGLRAAQLEPAWTFDANRASVQDGQFASGSEVTGYPVVADGCVYVGTSTGSQLPGWVFALNADTGEVVWRTRLSHGVYSTVAVGGGRVFAFVSRVGGAFQGEPSEPEPWGPYVVALDQGTGRVLWRRTVDWQIGSDAVSSPVVWDGMVWVGVSGTAAEGDAGERLGFQGSFALLDAVTGELLKKTWVIPPGEWDDGFAGGAIWSTVAVDVETGIGYVGTGNPFNYDREHEHTNAVLKIDLNRHLADGTPNPALGEILGSYKGDVEQYFPALAEASEEPCEEVEELSVFAAGVECGNLDLDFGAQPNIYRDAQGRKVVGAGQKSGVYHAIDPDTMQPLWTALVGVPSAVGGIVGTPAVDRWGVHGPHTLGGYLWSVDRNDGRQRWIAPLADGVHWGNPVSVANDVVYTVDLKGFLSAYDAATGLPLLQRPLSLGSDTWTDPPLTWGGVSIARNTVYVSVGVGLTSVGPDFPQLPNGFVIAFRPRSISPVHQRPTRG
jgi:polyvinyl alcohol dehydrogenase (cytochrome)